MFPMFIATIGNIPYFKRPMDHIKLVLIYLCIPPKSPNIAEIPPAFTKEMGVVVPSISSSTTEGPQRRRFRGACW